MSNYVHPIYEKEHADLRAELKELCVQADLCYDQVLAGCNDAKLALNILHDKIEVITDRCKIIRNISLKMKKD